MTDAAGSILRPGSQDMGQSAVHTAQVQLHKEHPNPCHQASGLLVAGDALAEDSLTALTCACPGGRVGPSLCLGSREAWGGLSPFDSHGCPSSAIHCRVASLNTGPFSKAVLTGRSLVTASRVFPI